MAEFGLVFLGAYPVGRLVTRPEHVREAAWDGRTWRLRWFFLVRPDIGRSPFRWTALHKAAILNQPRRAQRLLADAVDVNAKDAIGWTPLQWAATWGNDHIAKLLLANGADVNAKDSIGMTPLDCALANGHAEMRELLRKHGGKTGAELERAEKQGQTK